MQRKMQIKKGKRILSLTLAFFMLMMTACSSGEEKAQVYSYEKESEELTFFSSSDSELDFFMNDFFKRHVGYIDAEEGDMAVNSIKPGGGFDGMYNQSWNTMALTWFNSFDSLDSDRLTTIKNSLESVPVDRYGYVWDGTDTTKMALDSAGSNSTHSMGWPFPRATEAEGWVTYWDFNGDKGSYEGDAWTTNFNAGLDDGLLIGVTENEMGSVEFVSPELSGVNTIMTYHGPYLELDVRMYTEDAQNIDDIYVWYKNEASEEWTTEKCVSVKEIAALNYEFEPIYEHILYLPMYAEENWNSNDNLQIAQIKVEVRAKENTKIEGKFGLNYVRPVYDTRHTNINSDYINSLKYYYCFTGETEYLAEAIVNARKAINFYMQAYDEERHLNNQSYQIGHDGSKKGLGNAERLSSSLGNGYWDVLFMPKYDFQSNMYFYRALKDLAYLERALDTAGIEVDKSLSEVITADRYCNRGVSEYAYTADELDAIADTVLTELRKSTDDKAKTGFWDEETGRFAAGYDEEGTKLDYGYLMWNLEAVYYGIADEKQAQSIMDWVSGKRIVEADKESGGSVGEDIYYYEFAPRTTTMNKEGLFSGIYDTYIGGSIEFGTKQVQYGGAILYQSYYDLMNRIESYGADNAFSRLKSIQTWYEKVYDYYKNENEDPQPFDFYWDYYKQKIGITPQSGVHEGGGSGVLGLDGEFLESLLAIAAVPHGFFGIDSEDGKCLTIAPTLPGDLDYWKIENLAFNRVKYDVSVYENAVRIDSVRGDAEGLSIKVCIPVEKGNFTVLLNGKETTDYVEEDGRIIVTIPFASAIVQVQ